MAVRDRYYAVNNEHTHASPRQSTHILFVVELHIATRAAHERVGNTLVLNGECKLVAGESVAIVVLSTETRLYDATLVGFENVALVSYVVQLTSFHSIAKHPVVLDSNECGHKNNDGQDCKCYYFLQHDLVAYLLVLNFNTFCSHLQIFHQLVVVSAERIDVLTLLVPEHCFVAKTFEALNYWKCI